MAYFNEEIHTLKPLFKTRRRGGNTVSNCQMSFGCLLENNFISALKFCEQKNYIKVQKTNKDYNALFGADAHIEFLCPMNFKLNQLSVYVDITLDNKPYKIRFNKDKPLYTLENGLEFAISFKPNHSGFFKYRKPIVILEFRGEGYGDKINPFKDKNVYNYMPPSMMLLNQDMGCNPTYRSNRIWHRPVDYKKVDPIFTEKDISNIIRVLRQASLYLSYDIRYEYKGVEQRGTCKYASTEIDLNRDMIDKAVSRGGYQNEDN